MKIYTRKGDDGTTGLLFGGRVAKNGPQPTAYGVVDEAQAFVGLARAEVEQGSDLDHMLVHLERDLWVLMSELASAPENRSKLTPGQSLVTADMVTHLEHLIDQVIGAVRAADRIRGSRAEPPVGVARCGAHGCASGRTRDHRRVRRVVARVVVSQPPQRSVVDAGTMARGRVAHDPLGERPMTRP